MKLASRAIAFFYDNKHCKTAGLELGTSQRRWTWSRPPFISMKGQLPQRSFRDRLGVIYRGGQRTNERLHKWGLPRARTALPPTVPSAAAWESLKPRTWHTLLLGDILISLLYILTYIYFSLFLFHLPDSQIFPLRKSEPTEIGQNWAHFIYLNLPKFYESYAFKKT